MSTATLVAEVLLGVAAVPVVGVTAYLAALTVLSTGKDPPRAEPPCERFTVVVPAHDESAGIATTVESLLAMDYPAPLFHVLVIADNCTDDTAARARAAGATVLERTDPLLRGKGHALAFAFAHLRSDGRDSAIVVVDADTVVTPNLLRAFAARIEAGATALQARYGVRNPDASWRTQLMAIALSAYHDVRSLGRERLGVSCGLRGNGMCFTTALVRDVPHDVVSLVEDVEYGIQLGLAGHRVEYVHEASVLGEMVPGGASSVDQRVRWETGRAVMQRQYAGVLLERAVSRRDPTALDLAIDLLTPPLATIAVATLFGLSLSLGLSWLEGGLLVVTWPWLASMLGLALYGARGWQLSGTGTRGLVALAHVPAYVAWKLTLALRKRAAPGVWVRTARSGETR